MARLYRQTNANFNKSLGSSGALQPLYKISPLDAEQAPGGYLQKVKVSVTPTSSQAGDPPFMICAMNSDDLSIGDIITAQSLPKGGGTVWLSIKRALRADSEESSRNDGPVFIQIMTTAQGQGVATTVDAVCEAWGRFIEVSDE